MLGLGSDRECEGWLGSIRVGCTLSSSSILWGEGGGWREVESVHGETEALAGSLIDCTLSMALIRALSDTFSNDRDSQERASLSSWSRISSMSSSALESVRSSAADDVSSWRRFPLGGGEDLGNSIAAGDVSFEVKRRLSIIVPLRVPESRGWAGTGPSQ